MSKIPLLGHCRRRWLSSPYPLVAEQGGEGATRICAAPSLWMQARSLVNQLRALGHQPGERVAAPTSNGAAWIVGLVATLRAEGVYCAPELPTARAARFELHASGLLSTRSGLPGAVRPGPGLELSGPDGLVWLPADQLPLHPREERSSGWPEVVRIDAAWSDASTFVSDLLPALVSGLEISTVELAA